MQPQRILVDRPLSLGVNDQLTDVGLAHTKPDHGLDVTPLLVGGPKELAHCRHSDLDARMLPEKPIIKSQSNTAQRYQRMLDHLATSAAAGDWAAVRAVRIRESDNYAKVVMDYRQQLLLASLRQRAPD
jgi:hypothetical protein